MNIIRTSGLTLVELLIGIAIASLIVITLSYITLSTSNTTLQTTTRNNLIKEGQIAQQVISGRLSEAIYVWASGITPNIPLTTSGVTTKNTVDPTAAGSQQWKYGNNGTVAYYDPTKPAGTPYSQLFVAMILPPVNPSYGPSDNITNCTQREAGPTSTTTTDTNSATTTDGCYRFFAYYPMRRSYLTALSDTSLAASNKPLSDKSNDFPGDSTKDRWVLMEFRANLYDSTNNKMWTPDYGGSAVTVSSNLPKLGVSTNSLLLSSLQNNYLAERSGNVLVDYIKPGSVSFTVYRPGSPDTNGRIDPTIAPGSPDYVNANNGHVDYTFQLEKIVGNKKIQATSNTLGGSIVIKNWYCPKAMKTSPFALNCP